MCRRAGFGPRAAGCRPLVYKYLQVLNWSSFFVVDKQAHHNDVLWKVATSQSTCLCMNVIANHYFAKLPWPVVNEENLQASSQAATCFPHTVEASHCPFQYWTSSREVVKTNFYSVCIDPTEKRTRVYRFRCRRSIFSTSDRNDSWILKIWFSEGPKNVFEMAVHKFHGIKGDSVKPLPSAW